MPKNKNELQWVWDTDRFYVKKINKIKIRIKNLKQHLHRLTADVLTKRYDVILLPTFEVSDMVKVESKLSSKVSRRMLSLGHYQFKVYLKWIAKKRGKIVIDVDESYTSKTNPFTGKLMNIGSARTFKHDEKKSTLYKKFYWNCGDLTGKGNIRNYLKRLHQETGKRWKKGGSESYPDAFSRTYNELKDKLKD